MKVAITGATGFIGKWLLDDLPDTMDAVIVSRHPKPEHLTINRRAFSTRTTDYSYSSLCHAVTGCDAVIHLAAQRPASTNDVSYSGNTVRDYDLFRACAVTGIHNIVFASSRSIYALNPSVPWNERSDPAPLNPYALAKLHSEQTAAYFNHRGLRIKSLRLAQILGLGEREGSMITTFLKQACQRKTICLTVTGAIQREYLYVRDAARAVLVALSEAGRGGIFNVGSGQVCSISELAQTINAVFKNDNNLKLMPDAISLNENSLMDSALFQQTFNWKPRWGIPEAVEDIKLALENPARRWAFGF